jgi:hypothetical protein
MRRQRAENDVSKQCAADTGQWAVDSKQWAVDRKSVDSKQRAVNCGHGTVCSGQ